MTVAPFQRYIPPGLVLVLCWGVWPVIPDVMAFQQSPVTKGLPHRRWR